jgi:hypothetical protein
MSYVHGRQQLPFKQRGWYEDRRSLQIAASIVVAVVVMALVVWGLLWTRYRLAVGFAGLTVGFGIIRFISLHEVDAWNANAPKARTAIELVAAAGYRRWPSPGSASYNRVIEWLRTAKKG